MNVSDLHVGESCLVVVGGTVLSLVLWLNTKDAANRLSNKIIEKNLRFGSNLSKGLHFVLVGDLEFGFDVISD